jgi:hypothetical protein
MAVSIISTAQPQFRTTGLITLTSAQAYDAASPTATKPSTTSQSALLYDINSNYSSLLRLTPITSNNNFTSVGMRVVGWNPYVQTAGTKVWIPTVLADVTLAYTSGTVASLSIDSVTTYFFSSASIASGVPTVNTYSPATAASTNVQPASVVVDAIGSQLITLQFRATGTTPKMGAFWSTI